MKYVKILVPDDFEETYIADLHGQDRISHYEVFQPTYTKVLDHGYIGLVDFMGDDASVIRSARVSYGAGTKKVNTDEAMLRYMMRNQHLTPFESVEMQWHVKLPIFVARQWIRHRTAQVNEYSGRYSEMTDERYMPALAQLAPQSSTNKQGRDGDLSENDKLACQTILEHAFEESWTSYKALLGSGALPDALNNRRLFCEQAALEGIKKIRAEDDQREANGDQRLFPTNWREEEIDAKIHEYYEANELAIPGSDFSGLARELARICLPLSTYTQWYWKANLRNTFHFIGLRSDPHAQYEIRVYSDAMLDMMRPLVPWSVQAFLDYQLQGGKFSRIEMDLIRKTMQSIYSSEDPTGLADQLTKNGSSKREVTEFLKQVGL